MTPVPPIAAAPRPGVRVAVVIAALGIAGCAPAATVPGSGTHSRGQVATQPSLSEAMRLGLDLGPLPDGASLHLSLALAGRDPAGLQALLGRGGRLSPAQYADRFGPDPTRVEAIRRTLAAQGVATRWQPGQASLEADASAGAIQRLFGVSVDQFRLPDGTRFHAPVISPSVPASLRPTVTAVAGLSDYREFPVLAIRDPHGVSPGDMIDFYDAKPLRDAGFDGTGMTVVMPEWAMPPPSSLQAYATKFKLPPFNVEVHSDPSWGAPTAPDSPAAGEAALDLEVVHGIAPGAKEVVYELGDPTHFADMWRTLLTQHPGDIVTSSISAGWCEKEAGQQQVETTLDGLSTAAAAQGTSIFWASGDRGAFSCLPDKDASSLVVAADAAQTGLTAVGGTYAFLSAAGAYFKEVAWGQPVEQWGGGGGISSIITRPSWQTGPGVDTSNAMRLVPDISANADSQSGWDIFDAAGEGTVGGTSAAAPCWAAFVALINQDLKSKQLATVGFANPSLYLFGRHPSGLPAPAFHDITVGSNLHYPAGPGWDYATGLGSPEVAGLTDDFEWLARNPSAAST